MTIDAQFPFTNVLTVVYGFVHLFCTSTSVVSRKHYIVHSWQEMISVHVKIYTLLNVLYLERLPVAALFCVLKARSEYRYINSMTACMASIPFLHQRAVGDARSFATVMTFL